MWVRRVLSAEQVSRRHHCSRYGLPLGPRRISLRPFAGQPGSSSAPKLRVASSMHCIDQKNVNVTDGKPRGNGEDQPKLLSIYERALVREEIRLVHIESVVKETIRCRLETKTLSDASGKYIALSWCWNEGNTLPETIIVNGAELEVQANVVAMLRQVYQLQSSLNPDSLPFWIDIISIDQRGTDEASRKEKNNQIKLQNKVYRGARSVFAWIGVAADNSDLFMSVLQYLHLRLGAGSGQAPLRNLHGIVEHCAGVHGITQHTLDSVMDSLTQYRSSRQGVVPAGLKQYSHPLWQAWMKFGSRPWFERQWILQEFMLCPSTTIICGNEYVDWRALLFWTTRQLQPEAKSIPNADFEQLQRNIVRIFMLVRQRERAEENAFSASFPLDYLLRTMSFRGAKATVPHDYIYGLLGLVSDDVRQSITVDYENLEASDVFLQAIKVACFNGQPGSTAALMWESHEMRANMGLESREHVVSWCPNLQNTTLNIQGEAIFPQNFGHSSAGLDPSIINSTRGALGSSSTTVAVDVIVLDVVHRVATGPFGATCGTEDLQFAVESLKQPTNAWFNEIMQLWQLAEDPIVSKSMFLDDFLNSPTFPHLRVEEKMAVYEQLQRFVQQPLDGSDDEQVVMNAASRSLDPDDQIRKHLSASLTRLKVHAQSAYCLTQSGRFGRCISQHVLPGDLICLIPGADWLHIFRETGSAAGRKVYRRITIGWCTHWSENKPCEKTADDLETFEIQ